MQGHGKNIDLEMGIEGRKFMNADGEIFIGPGEDGMNGWLKSTFSANCHGNAVHGIQLSVENSLITQAAAEENKMFLLAMRHTDARSRRLGDFAIGTHKGIDHITGHILLGEPSSDPVHVAVGMARRETLAVNRSIVHWDMICDLRDPGILVEGQPFYQNGQFPVG